LKHLGLDHAQRERRIDAQLERLDATHLAERSSYTLSGGERQLVALAAVLLMEPSLLVFDEPTHQLDLRNRNRVRASIDALDCPVIVVSHDLDLLQDFERVLVLIAGRVVVDDTPQAAVRYYREHCA
jgi:biotin transport system ATP-binding protein